MLVYENLKNDNVLRHFKQRFAQLDTLIKNPIWVKAPVIALGLNNQHHADINKTDSLFWSKTAHEHLALNRHNGLEVTGTGLEHHQLEVLQRQGEKNKNCSCQ